ncbi:hypothetical protein ACM66B_003749 [Microbotryomycetes sp. NB124-2]
MVQDDDTVAALAYAQQFDLNEANTSDTSRHAAAVLRSTQPEKLELPVELLTVVCTNLLVPPRVLSKLQHPSSPDDDDEPSNLDASDILIAQRFLKHVPSLLELAHAAASISPTSNGAREPGWQAPCVMTLARYSSPSLALSQQHRELAIAAIKAVVSRSDESQVAHELLSKHLPRLFKAHPKLNPQTGRAALTVPGGDQAVLNWYEQSEGQAHSWRTEPWLDGVVEYTITSTPTNEIERSWPLLLPPLLAYLDDYDAYYKKCGVRLLTKLLDKVDGSLLTRTGVGAIFEKSLQACIMNLSSPCSPQLVLDSVSATLQLIDLLYPPLANSTGAHSLTESRFDALCTLFDVSVLHVWSFKGGATSFEQVAAQVLVQLVDRLGLLSVRFLDIVGPKLVQTLISTSELVQVGTKSFSTSLQNDGGAPDDESDPTTTTTRLTNLIKQCCLALVKQIEVLNECQDRLERFEARIMVGVAKAWTNIFIDGLKGRSQQGREQDRPSELSQRDEDDWEEVKSSLLSIVKVLKRVGLNKYAQRLSEVDAEAFRPLIA